MHAPDFIGLYLYKMIRATFLIDIFGTRDYYNLDYNNHDYYERGVF